MHSSALPPAFGISGAAPSETAPALDPTPRPHVMRVESNWKSTTPDGWGIDLAQRTILTGPNRSGKSRVIEAIELALTGEISDLIGRGRVKAPKMLQDGFPAEAKEFFAVAILSDGTRAEWRGKPGKNPKWAAPKDAVVLGVRAVREALGGSPDAAERWISERIGLSDTALLGVVLEKGERVDEKKKHGRKGAREADPAGCVEAAAPLLRRPLDEEARAMLKLAVEATPKGPGQAASVVTTLEARARDLRSEASHHQTAAEALREALPPAISDDEMARVKVVRQQAQAGLQAAQEAARAYHDLIPRHQRMLAAQAEQAAAPGLPEGQAPPAAAFLMVEHSITAINAVLALYAEQGGEPSACPVCQQAANGDTLRASRATYQAWLVAKQAFVQARDHQMGLQFTARTAVEDFERAFAAIPPAVVGIITDPDYDAVARVERAHAAFKATDDAYARAVEAQVGVKGPKVSEGHAASAERRAQGAKAAAEAVARELTYAVGEAVEDLCERASAFLPAAMGRVWVALRPGVRWGIIPPGENAPHPMPSGATEAALWLALGAALAPPEGTLVLTGMDRWLDPQTAHGIIAGFASWYDGQILLPMVQIPPGDAREETTGWAIVECAP